MDLSNSYDTKFKTPKLMQNLSSRPSCKTDAKVLTRTLQFKFVLSIVKKTRSANLSFPAQMCNLSNSDQKECMGIALHHAGNKDTFTCQNITLHFRQKFSAKILVWFDFCFTALQHILGHFGHGQ